MVLFQNKSKVHLKYLLFYFLISEVTTDNPPNQQSALCVCCSQSFLESKQVKNKINREFLSKNQGRQLKNKISGLITVKNIKGKGEKEDISYKLWTAEKRQAEIDGRENWSDLYYNPVILAGVISGRPGFLSAHAATLTQKIIVGNAMECHC